jgi:diguanylate cyclase (GGDEF)-like protein
MNVDDVLILVEQTLLNRQLSPIERLVLQQSWLGQSYSEIAQHSSYVSGYIKEVGSQLWQELSESVGDRVTKKNLQLVLREYRDRRNRELSAANQNLVASSPELTSTEIFFPSAPLPANSPFYILRPPIETLISRTLQQSGCAIRIKGPQKMGKTSLLNYVLDRAQNLNYQTVAIDFQEAEKTIFSSLDRYLRWFCANVSRQLGLESLQDEYWDEDMGSKVSCKIYFETYLLKRINRPIAIALDEVHRLFDYPEIAQEFLPMLRFWHEQAQRLDSWGKVRLIVAYASEAYFPFQFNQSPFNVGLAVKLPPLTLRQIQELGRRYGIEWVTGENGLDRLAPLAAMVGGHPYLISIAFYHLSRGHMTLEELLASAPTQSGVYSDHLRHYLALLQKDRPVAIALQQVVAAQTSVTLDAIAAYQLDSMGLVQLEGNQAKPSCDLYRLYFRQQLESQPGLTNLVPAAIASSESHGDVLTKLFNRRYFYQYLAAQWNQWRDRQAQISLILGEVDYFQFYNASNGEQAGDRCLQRIAQTLKLVFQAETTLLVRYSGPRFLALLVDRDRETAIALAEKARLAIRDLAIDYNHSRLGGFHSNVVTISVGVAIIAITAPVTSETLMSSAEEALYLAKRSGRDCVATLEPSL